MIASLLALMCAAQAHLMVAQHDTLPFTEEGAYFLASVPVSAFTGVDDDGDGALSEAELSAHHASLEQQVHAAVRLVGAEEHTLEGLLLNRVHDHFDEDIATSQLVVMGRFPPTEGEPTLHFGLFGAGPTERAVTFRITRDTAETELVFTPSATALRPFGTSASSAGLGWIGLGLAGLTAAVAVRRLGQRRA